MSWASAIWSRNHGMTTGRSSSYRCALLHCDELKWAEMAYFTICKILCWAHSRVSSRAGMRTLAPPGIPISAGDQKVRDQLRKGAYIACFSSTNQLLLHHVVHNIYGLTYGEQGAMIKVQIRSLVAHCHLDEKSNFTLSAPHYSLLDVDCMGCGCWNRQNSSEI